MNKINQQRLNKFATAYENQLLKAITNFPNEYAFGPLAVPTVAAKMKAAFSAGSYNKDGRAVRETCKELGIKHTYLGINTYLTDPSDIAGLTTA